MAKKKAKRPASKKVKRPAKRPASKKVKRSQKVKRSNPAMKTVSQSTGWIQADAVRFVKVKGKPVQVLVKRSKRK